ncbi:putative receptor-like protein kinase At3g47110 [Ananas comosus]|uniref:non-specific serine/threonine protein kinase n=1 Tax=Ananas comosus TaxID=4615 RepID=A0A6P5FR97_ANACO|nr:putative receptor-like protein kinase At3g47110 [Ananas comosus]
MASFLLPGILMLLLFIFFCPQLTISLEHSSNFTDLTALLSFKSHIQDPNGILDKSWNSNTSFCSWIGVSCSSRRQRVVALRLEGLSLQGSISPQLGNLSFMADLDLGNNSLTGPIPASLGRLPRLKSLILEHNQLSGRIPSTVFNMSSLTHLSFTSNNLSGPLVADHNTNFTIPLLEFFSVESNQLNGTVPPGFLQCQNLQQLSLSTNYFSGGIPTELAKLNKLSILFLDTNYLIGSIPASLGNLTYLTQLDLHSNHLQGEIPPELGDLLNLQWLWLGGNNLTGELPAFVSNMSMIRVMDFSSNNLAKVPIELGKNLPFLTTIGLSWNKVSGGLDFIYSLSNCRQLQNIDLSHNELEGVIPDSIANLSTSVMKFAVNGNRITGGIPAGFNNLSNLLFLNLRYNELTGTIPPEIAEIGALQALYLGYNTISGSIPPELGRLKSLSELSLENNALSGSIPDSIGNISSLQFLWLRANKLSSSIPRSLWGLPALVGLYLAQNALEGVIHPDVENMMAITQLDLSSNRLSGSIPDTLGQLQMLAALDLSNNLFNCLMPQSLGKLISIEYLDLSHNEFSGAIPNSLADLRHLATLNLSFNKLEGPIPSGGVFSNISFQSLMGNAALCGLSKLGFSPCVIKSTNFHSSAKLHKLKIILPTIALSIMLFSCFFILYWRKGRKVVSSPKIPHLHEYSLIPYHELARATDGFSESNFLGTGSSGSVYRGRLDDGLLVAVKVLDLENKTSLRSFESECRALGMIRHRNLVRIISTCSNLDFKALVLQYMPNGSLERWLYSSPECCLTLLQRINIVLDVALALEYLHHQLDQVVVHCDVKPSNILLDEEMNARLSDFGIAKLLASDSKSLVSASIAGTFGYMPPEYGTTGRVSRRGDVYSYGILLLEIFTRKKPTDLMFAGELNLRRWVFDAYSTRLFDVLDANLLGDPLVGDERTLEDHSARSRCLLSIIELALQCSTDSPKERISMKDAVAKMQKIKMEYLRKLPNN